MLNLDNSADILKTQGGNQVINSIDSLPKQLRQAFDESQKTVFPEDYRQVKNVLVCGMGGSRFPALIVRELFKDIIRVPYLINDDYTLPGFVDKNTLVIMSSYSGTTEEVISTGKKAHIAGAKLAGIAMGGEVASFLKNLGAPAYIFNPVYNTSGQPRIGFGYNVGGHLGFLMKLGFIEIDKNIVAESLDNLTSLLESFKINIPKSNNPAKQLAEKLHNKYPYYIVSEFLTGVGNAIANQTNETAKSISSFRVIPELNHHLMEGLKFPDELHQIAVFVFFYSGLYSSQIQKRFRITKDVVEQNKVQTHWHELKGKNKLEQTLEFMGLGGYVSMYLAALYNQNPSAIPYVDYFKTQLKK